MSSDLNKSVAAMILQFVAGFKWLFMSPMDSRHISSDLQVALLRSSIAQPRRITWDTPSVGLIPGRRNPTRISANYVGYPWDSLIKVAVAFVAVLGFTTITGATQNCGTFTGKLLPEDHPLNDRTVDWNRKGFAGTVLGLLRKSFEGEGSGALAGIFDREQWQQVAHITAENILKADGQLHPTNHPLFTIAQEAGIDLTKEPHRGYRDVFWAVEFPSPVPNGGFIATGHRQRIAVNYLDGKPRVVEVFSYHEAEKVWRPAVVKIENGLVIPLETFLGKPVTEKCMKCHTQLDGGALPKNNPLPAIIWSGKYPDFEDMGWRFRLLGVRDGLRLNYSPERAYRKNVFEFVE